jgi:SH3-like domain-containing protein
LTLLVDAFLLLGMMKQFACILTVFSVFALALPTAHGAVQSGIVKAERVNVRTQPNILSEVVSQVNTGDNVQVLETILHEKPIPGNPREWYRIGIPEGAVLWVAGDYVDPTGQTVTASRLNVRAGPSESYTVVARLNRGDKVERIKESGGWISIKPPVSSFAYVATSFIDLISETEQPPALEQERVIPVDVEKVSEGGNEEIPLLIVDNPDSGEDRVLKSTIDGNQPDNDELPVVQPAAQNTPPTPVQTEIPPEKVQPEIIASKPIDDPSLSENPENTNEQAVLEDSGLKPLETIEPSSLSDEQVRLPSEIIVAENPSDALDELRRIVTREGIVRRSRSIQSPTYHRLEDPLTHKTMNYLYTGRLHLNTSPSRTDLKPYEGYRIRVTGQESVDLRWPKIPVIEIEELKIAD